MQLLYENVDIFDQVAISQCIYDSYAESQSDTLRVVFADGNDLWDAWKPEKNHKIRAVLGGCDTGDMYVMSVRPENGKMCLRASSVPPSHNDKSNKSWTAVRFKQLCQEIAGRHNLTCEFYGVTDYTYEYVNQQNKEDFIFLSERCVLEGCAFLVYKGKLVVYSESYIENQAAGNVLDIPQSVKFEYQDSSQDAYSSCAVKNGTFVGQYSAGEGEKVITKVINTRMSSQAEANRYAMNILRFSNKGMTSGVVTSDYYLPGFAAGTLIQLNTAGTPSWNVPVFMTHVRHDMVKATTKLFFRKTLGGY